jgi:hypothetical protein
MCLATRPLLIYLAGVLFPEGAVAGGRRSPLSFHSITSSALASRVGGTPFDGEIALADEWVRLRFPQLILSNRHF